MRDDAGPSTLEKPEQPDALFEAHPWLFGREATPAQRERQAAHQRGLAEHMDIEIGEGCYLSPAAHLWAERLRFGPRCIVAAGVRISGDVAMGEGCSMNLNASVIGQVRMGSWVRIAAGAVLAGFDHVSDDLERPIALQGVVSKGIDVGDDVWIGANAVITDGVRIGSHAIVAGGAVVTRDVPDWAVVGGNPARLLRDRRRRRGGGTDTEADALRAFDQRIGDEWRGILAQSRSTDGASAYVDPRNRGNAPFRAECDAIQIASMWGEVPEPFDRAEWAARLARLQDPASGLCFNPGTPEAVRADPGADPGGDNLYNILCIGYALEVLGERFRHPIGWFDRMPAKDLERLLDGLPWASRGWGSGAVVDALGTACYVNARHFGSVGPFATLMGWLTLRADPVTGLWSEPVHGDWLQPVNGFYRLTRGTYAQFGLPLQYPERAIDTILAHVERNARFERAGFNACNVLDVVHPLMLCAKQTAHRSSEIAELFRGFLRAAMGHYRPGAGFPFARGEEPGLQGTEMWLSVVVLLAIHLGVDNLLRCKLTGVHRWPPAWSVRG